MREYDNETLKKVQSVLLDVLKELQRVCDKNGIELVAEGGTAIGAVRHNGFIPWDDDIDVTVLRKDYDRLMEILPKELGENFGTDNWIDNKDFPAPTACVYAKNTLMVSEPMKNCKYKYGIAIGIYPYDNIPDDDKKAKHQVRECWFWMRLHWLKVLPFPYIPYRGIKKTIIHAICGIAHVCLLPFSKKWLVKKCEAASRRYNDIETNRAAILSYTYPWTTIIPKDSAFPTETMPFEDTNIKMFGCWHDLLTQEYGDYMQLPPKEKRKNHFPIILKFSQDQTKEV